MKMCCNVYRIPFAFYMIISFVFLLLIAGSGSAYSESRINAEAVDFNSKLGSTSLSSHIEKRDDPSVTNTVWFGPRLGRKKRSAVTEDGAHDKYSRLFGNQSPQVLALYLDDEIPPVSDERWTGPHHRLQKRSTLSDDDVSDSSTLEYYVLQLLKHYPRILNIFRNDNSDRDGEPAKTRYGRGNTWPDEGKMGLKTPPFSPRSGRSSLLPLKPRLGRGGSNSEASAVFKPRLGRSNINEFSEYGEFENSIDDKDH